MAVEGHTTPSRMGVGVIGGSPRGPGWAVTAHLPALAALPDYELRAVATSPEASARAAAEAYGVPGHADPAALIARRDVDLVVVTVKLPHHHRLVGAALAAGKLVMCEWPLGVDAGQTADLAERAAGAGLGTLIGLQARMAPSIQYARDLVAQGYVGEVLATTLVGSGIAWTSVTDSAHAYMFEAAGNATLLSVPTMHALDALQFVLGDLADIRATSAVRRPHARRHRAGLRACPSCASHAGLHYERGGERHRATSCDGDTDMRVMAVRRAGGPDVLELVDIPEPTPGPGQALVEVHAAGVNFMDSGVRQGLFWTEMRYPKRLGVEGAGRVRAVGAGVDAIRPGERVAWVYAPGSYAEHVIVPAAALWPLPVAIDDRTAAAVMRHGLTASNITT